MNFNFNMKADIVLIILFIFCLSLSFILIHLYFNYHCTFFDEVNWANLTHIIPKLSFPSNIAVIRFFSKISFVGYSGKSNVLKLKLNLNYHVWATGRFLISYTF